MKSYVIFTRRGLLCILACLLLAIFATGRFYAIGNLSTDGKTNENRLSFIMSLGLEVAEESASTRCIYIPQRFSDVYENYNELQNSAGYDLSAFRGCEVTVYTYEIKTPEGYSGDCVVNLMVYRDRIIGGDISSSQLDGFMLPLCKI